MMRDEDPFPTAYLAVVTALVLVLALVVWWARQ